MSLDVRHDKLMYSTGYFTITYRAPEGEDWHFPDEEAKRSQPLVVDFAEK
jgi:hypothetical protein